MEKVLASKVEDGRHYIVRCAGSDIFEVQSHHRYVVDLSNWRCSFGVWTVKGFPYSHAIAAIHQDRKDVYSYIQCYFTTEFFIKSHAEPVYPVPDMILDGEMYRNSDDDELMPSLIKKQSGKPKNQRIKSSGEVITRKTKCSGCGWKP